MMRRLGWICVCVVLGMACERPPGADGLEGRQGPTGEPGDVGMEGESGDSGKTGEPGTPGAEGDPGAPCWDLDGDGKADAAEDVNGDGDWNASDCRGAPGDDGNSGVACWDLDGDGKTDSAEDVNGDDRWDAADCAGAPGDAAHGASIDTALDPWQDQPGLVVEITAVAGGSRNDERFGVGDLIEVTFTATLNNGTPVPLDQLDGGGILVSGPTDNYQRVLPRQADLLTRSVTNPDGSYTYTFSTPIPALYLPPYNDTASFGLDDGELQGLALDEGTYTVGLELWKFYQVGAEEVPDAGNATQDFLLGGASALEPREIVTQNNCNQCHVELRAHDGIWRDAKMCVLCHTAGAEDKNDPLVEDGTPGVSTELRRMVHRIHDGAHLPSVLGIATKADGTRDYAATPAFLKFVGFGNAVEDFSAVSFPVFPNLSIPMPRDQGHALLSTGQQAQEDAQRKGATACFKCHGDPDGPGPMLAPADGDEAYDEPSRAACGSCHDDVDFTHAYTSNGMTMPAQASDGACRGCHAASGTDAMAVDKAHLHPLHDATINVGLEVTLTGVSEAGTNDGDGSIDPGEKVAVAFTVTNDADADVPLSEVASLSTVISGPTWNYNLLLSTSIPTAALGAGPTYATNLPEPVVLEFVGKAGDDSAIEALATARTPHWNVTGAATTVYQRTATSGGATTTSAHAAALANYVDVASTTDFVRNDYLVLGDTTGGEEYSRVALAEGSRLWLTKPLGFAHPAGESVLEVTLTTQTVATDYTLDAQTGTLTEAANASFGAGNAIVVSYTSDFVMPAVYPPPLNDSPDLDETWGEWKGKALVSGTYTVGVWGYRNLCVKPDHTAAAYTACTTGQPDFGPDNTSYRGPSEAHNVDVLVGAASTLEPFVTISSGDTCNACHEDLMFHGGGRRGFDWCITCHGTAGSEDRPRYSAGNAPATTGGTINFRTMLHKIHRGSGLTHADDYTVVGYGAGAYPNNFTAYEFGEIEFPAMPDGVKHCPKCHGTSESWQAPRDRAHPNQQGQPERVWRAVCGACHDSDAANAHITIMTTDQGEESCAVCHGPGRDLAVERAHKPR